MTDALGRLTNALADWYAAVSCCAFLSITGLRDNILDGSVRVPTAIH